ncbi:MAG TPA: carbamate kinase [Actinomycetota bacterium]
MRIVVALGGNAILKRGDRGTIAQQRAAVREACEELAVLAAGNELVVTHGNGPQVGRLMLQDEAMPDALPRFPLDVHVAETQGQLGYLIQQELSAALVRARDPRPVVTLVTQVVVDAGDPGFIRPTKPVGPHLSKKGAAEYRARGVPIAEVPGGGWRRVVASPEPVAIVEAGTIRALADAGAVPIAAGGGGVPVVRDGSGVRGVAAVIDKDLTAAVLARAVGADALLIVTDVDAVYRKFGTDDAEPISMLRAADARAGVEDGTFARGSMAEKVLAAAAAAEAGMRAVITSLGRGREALAGEAGTRVVLDEEIS